jgi:hypothetical protein
LLVATIDVEGRLWDVLVIYLINPRETPVSASGQPQGDCPYRERKAGRGVSLS